MQSHTESYYYVQGDSMEWTDEYVQIICSLMAEQVEQGNRPNTHLNPSAYNTVSEKFYQMTAISLSKMQLKNKWDKLKGDWSCWNKLMRKQTGTGWDSSMGVIVMDNEWWKKARKDIPGCGKFRKKPLQNQLHISKMFGNILNDEQDHWNPMSDNPIIPPSQENLVDVDNIVEVGEEELYEIPEDVGNVVGGEEDEVQEVSPCIANAKKIPRVLVEKNKKQKSSTSVVIQDKITKIAECAASFTSMKQGEVTIKEVMDMVLECGAVYGSDEHDIATQLFVKKEQREMFKTLPKECRFNWLKRRYNDKYGN
ncbi:hypothetical protein ZWY2020_048245 [Hordeum vulgare]|nr:hypothetical protein ZWY2020_048245 [Hordeum vulgare]